MHTFPALLPLTIGYNLAMPHTSHKKYIPMVTIYKASEDDFDTLTNIWEASVRATHDFLSEADIAWLRPQIRNVYLKAVDSYAFQKPQGNILGFVGVASGKIEMLFISPQARGQGIGKQLLHYAIVHAGATELDVNEQNPQATGFYQHLGFEIMGRSPVDGMGKPFPLLHMRLKPASD